MPPSHSRCWICESVELELVRPSQIEGELTSAAFAITDSHYGRTGAVHRCRACGFLQCSDLALVVQYYEGLQDERYEETRAPRSRQMRRLLERLQRAVPQPPGARLVDIGAGSGLLVEEALQMGFDAVGVEPSRWLQKRAVDRSVPVEPGTFPHPNLSGPFDVVTVVDVIEHVSDPVGLLRHARSALAPEGVVVVVTPDVGALAPKILGWKWWHFRVAHIGYFRRKTLELALERAGLELVHLSRPTWVLDLGYLAQRVNAYLPRWMHVPLPGWTSRIWLPITLGDILFAVGRPVREAS